MPRSLLIEIGWFGFGRCRWDKPPRHLLMLGPIQIVVSAGSILERERKLADLERQLVLTRLALSIAKDSASAETPAPLTSPPGDPAQPGSGAAFLDVSSLNLPSPAHVADDGLFPESETSAIVDQEKPG